MALHIRTMTRWAAPSCCTAFNPMVHSLPRTLTRRQRDAHGVIYELMMRDGELAMDADQGLEDWFKRTAA